jgi:hypothetical protein
MDAAKDIYKEMLSIWAYALVNYHILVTLIFLGLLLSHFVQLKIWKLIVGEKRWLPYFLFILVNVHYMEIVSSEWCRS